MRHDGRMLLHDLAHDNLLDCAVAHTDYVDAALRSVEHLTVERVAASFLSLDTFNGINVCSLSYFYANNGLSQFAVRVDLDGYVCLVRL